MYCLDATDLKLCQLIWPTSSGRHSDMIMLRVWNIHSGMPRIFQHITLGTRNPLFMCCMRLKGCINACKGKMTIYIEGLVKWWIWDVHPNDYLRYKSPLSHMHWINMDAELISSCTTSFNSSGICKFLSCIPMKFWQHLLPQGTGIQIVREIKYVQTK